MAKEERQESKDEAKEERQESSNEQPQKYDGPFKKWITEQVDEILPILVTGMKYEQELNVEFSRSMVRADKVFQVFYRNKQYILNIEFQVGADKHLPSRLLLYSAALYHKYHLPVMSMVIYPFSVKMAVSPLVIPNSEKDLLIFHFDTMPLFHMDAEPFVQNHQTCMYPLLPAMRGFHADMAVQAMNELSERYRDDQNTLIEQFVWMQLCLDRTGTIKLAEKIQIKGRLNMYDQLWEESPTIQKMREDYRIKGLQEGLLKGHEKGLQEGLLKGQKGLQEGLQEAHQEELQRLQHLLVDVVRTKCPDLVSLAQQQAKNFDKPDALYLLMQQILNAPNADFVRWLLEPKTM